MADGIGDERPEGTMRFQIFHLEPDDEIVIDINGRAVPPDAVRRDHRPDADPASTRFELSLGDCQVLQFDNELGITPGPLSDRPHPPYMEELEVFVS